MTDQNQNWGGRRDGAGRPPLQKKREKVSTRLAPGSKQLAIAIAKELELDGWGHAVDLALVKLFENLGLTIK